MADVLSQTEVETLLAALDPGKPTVGSSASAPRRSEDGRTQISVYDFKRPERVSKDQMRAFQALHEGFSREFGAALSGMLRTIVEVKLISVDQLTYSEFVFSLENPTCFNLLQSEGLDGSLILDLNPSILFPIVDRLLGGGKETKQSFPSRPLTEIELTIVKRITEKAMRLMEKAWANIAKLSLRVTQVESNPQLVQIVPPNEVVVLISFELTMGEMRGIMNLCIPFNTIEPLAHKLSSDSWSAYTKKAIDPRQKMNLETSIQQAGLKMVVRLADTQITAGELLDLSVGDVIVTGKPKGDGLQVMLEGRPMFQGHAGVYRGHKAIRIGPLITRPQDLVERKLKSLDAKPEAKAEAKPDPKLDVKTPARTGPAKKA